MARILHVIPYFAPAYGYGGPVQVCLDLAATQVQHGHDVHVLTTDALDERSRIAERSATIEGVAITRLPNLSTRLAKRQNLHVPLGLGRWLDEHLGELDVVHLHDYFTVLNVLASRRCRARGIPYVVQPHGVAAPAPAQRLYWIKRTFNGLWGRELLRGARRIIAVSELERGELERYAPECRAQIVVVPNGLRGRAPARAPRDRAALDLRDDDKIILSLARLHENKGFDRLLRALAHLDESWRLLIGGADNGARPALDALVAELGLGRRVRFLGLVTGQEKERAFGAADVFALLSRYEPFALAVVEALGHGLPVCLSPSVGVAQMIEPLGCAIVTGDPDDAAATAAELARLYSERAKRGERALEAARRFDVGEAARAIDEAYGLGRASSSP